MAVTPGGKCDVFPFAVFALSNQVLGLPPAANASPILGSFARKRAA